jgi:voltage-gated potassium channel
MIGSSVDVAARDTSRDHRALVHERTKLIIRIDKWLEGPMTVLGFVWVILIVLDLTRGLSPYLEHVSYAIWALFVVHFAIDLVIAPHKLGYLRRNWLTVVALLLPAVRVLAIFRFARVLRAVRGVRLVRVVAGANRGMRALGRIMGRRGFGYVAGLSLIVVAAGAAGMQAFEHTVPNTAVGNYGSTLWWTAMMLTTMGSDYFPHTAQGRMLCLLLAIYGFAVFGYITATVASYFVARDADTPEGDVAGSKEIAALQRQIGELLVKVDTLTAVVSQSTHAVGGDSRTPRV